MGLLGHFANNGPKQWEIFSLRELYETSWELARFWRQQDDTQSYYKGSTDIFSWIEIPLGLCVPIPTVKDHPMSKDMTFGLQGCHWGKINISYHCGNG